MIAKFNGICRWCDAGIHPGEQIEVFLKKWTHTACKKAELAARTHAAGEVVVIPAEEPPEVREFVGVRRIRQEGLRALNGR